MTLEEQQHIIEIRRIRLAAHNAKQAYDGAVKRKRQLAGRIKGLKDTVRHLEENLRKLTDEQLPELKKQCELAENRVKIEPRSLVSEV
jgi:hypothetical protein